MKWFRTAASVSALTACILASGAHAQSANDGTDQKKASPSKGSSEEAQDIIVTAQKSGAQALQSVPLAIQVFSGEELKQRNITSIDDLVSSVPGAFEGQRQTVGSRSYNLRGAGGSNANGDSPVGYYLDDVPFIVTNFGIAPPVRFVDVDRVEVLRGPQGTLYGQGSSGGVFIFHTRDPDLNNIQFAAEGNLSHTKLADGANYGVSGVISIPIIKDMLAIRVSGGHSYNPGWADEYFGPYDGTPDRKGVNFVRNDDIRVVALFKPIDELTLRAQYWNFRPRQDFTGFTASVNPPYFENTANQPSFGNGDFKLYSFTATADFKSFSVTSATSYLKGTFGIYIPISPVGFFSSQFFPDMFAEEVRINSTTSGPFHWVIGTQYQDGSGPQANQLSTQNFGFIADNNTITKNWAVFGEVSYDLLDGKLVPLVGLRQYHDKRTFKDGSSSQSSTTNVTTWRVNLSYLPTDHLTMFVTAATGFRAGIIQSQAQASALALDNIPGGIQLQPEDSTNYEVGLKWRSADNRISVGLNGYITKFKNMQTSVNTSVGIGGFTNFGDATTKGIDFELRWRTPLEGLTLSAVGNINDGKFDTVNPQVQTALPLVRPGARMVNTIQNNYRLDANYLGHITDSVDLFGNVGWSHSGNRLQANGIIANPYGLLSFTVGLRKGPYELAIIGDNMLDERGPTFVGTTGPRSGSGPTPQTIGMRFRVNFQ